MIRLGAVQEDVETNFKKSNIDTCEFRAKYRDSLFDGVVGNQIPVIYEIDDTQLTDSNKL